MTRRCCHYCTRPLTWWGSLMRYRVCDDCAYRMSHGGSPRRPPTLSPPPPSG